MAVATKCGGGLTATGGSGGICTIWPGDPVEIFGLTSESGRQLNGCHGVATKRIPETGRFEVRIGAERRATVKAENLRIVHKGGGKVVQDLGFGDHDRKKEIEAAAMFRPDDLAEVVGLDTPMGRDLNGKVGTVVEDPETPPDRVKVRFELGGPGGGLRHQTLKPAHLRRVTLAGLTDTQRAQLGRLADAGGAGAGAEAGDEFTRVDLAVAGAGVPERGPGLPVSPGDVVEVSGLASEAGRRINGQKGVVLQCADGRAEVRLPSGPKKLKFENLAGIDFAGGDRLWVEVFGLQSESGRAMNGQRGFATSRSDETGRFEVKLSKDKKVSLKPDNLRLLST